MSDLLPLSVKPTTKSNGIPWKTFAQIILTLIIGFSMPVLACYGMMIAFALSTTMMVGDTGSSSSGGSGDAIAIVRVEGLILTDAGPFDTEIASATQIIEDLQQANDDPSVKAIVLAINSPGGGVNASNLIYHQITQIEKPVVVSMSDVAASGGYYVAAPTNWIIANPNTLTGSIGVISQFVEVSEFLDEYGIEVITLTTGDHKDTGSFSRDMTEEEREYWQTIIDETYVEFVEIVADGRNMTEEEVRQLADGSVYTGRQALENGLVDQLGYQSDAIDKAADLGGIVGEPRIVEYYHEPTFSDLLTGYATNQSPFPNVLALLEQFSTPSLEVRWIGQ